MGHAGENVNLVGHAVDNEGVAAFAVDDGGEVGVEVFFNVRCNERFAVFRGKHDVDEEIGEGGSHRLPRPYRALLCCRYGYPGLKPGATVSRPLRGRW